MRRFLEWFFVGLVCLFLIIIALPNFSSSNPGAKKASVKSNMHSFQTILETYASNADGLYPKNVKELYKFANIGKNKYWKDFKSPFSGNIGKGNSYDDFDKKLLEKNPNSWFFKEEARCTGCVYYDVSISENGEINKYFLYGSYKDGEIIIDLQSGLPFTLSNN